MEPFGPCAAELALYLGRRFWDVLEVGWSVLQFFRCDNVPSVSFWLLFGCHFEVGGMLLET